MAVSENSSTQKNNPQRTFQFSLKQVFFVVALLSTSLALFGTFGILLSAFILFIWAFIFVGKHPQFRFAIAGLLFVMFGGCFLTLCIAVSDARESGRRSVCSSIAKQIALALLNYQADKKSFPPLSVSDERGRPAHSWRILIMPYLERNDIYDDYHFDEPWNGIHNKKIISRRPYWLVCPAHGRTYDGGGWTYFRIAPTENDSTDSSCILLMEDETLRPEWTEPRDLSFEEAVTTLSRETQQHGVSRQNEELHLDTDFFFEYYHRGRTVVFKDGVTRFVFGPLPEDVARRILGPGMTRELAEKELDAHDNRFFGTKDICVRWSNWLRLIVFLVIVFSPAFYLPKSPPPTLPVCDLPPRSPFHEARSVITDVAPNFTFFES